jgi:hypothetical protein
MMRCQPCCSHSGSLLVYTLQNLEELPISPLWMSPFCVFFLLILVRSLPGDLQLWTVTHVCVLPERVVLLPKLWFSILNIPVQSPLLGHAPTTIPPTQCAFLMVSIYVLIPYITLGNNG